MTPAIPPSHPLRRWFQGLVEYALFTDVGICEPAVADYLSQLLTGFLHVDQIYLFRDANGKRLHEIGEMLARAAEAGDVSLTARRRRIHRHVGDYAMFWSGIYPESLRTQASAGGADCLREYLGEGKRAYRVASELSQEQDRPSPRLLRQLSEDFEYCVYGLALVRRSWEQEDPEGYSSIRDALGA